MIWPQYPTVPSLFAAPDRRRKDASAGGGGGGGGAAAGSIQHSRRQQRPKQKGRKEASERASSRVSATACGCNYEGQARSCCIGIAIPMLVFSGYRLTTAIALVACQCQAPPSYGQLEPAQLETATESNTSAGVVFLLPSHLLLP